MRLAGGFPPAFRGPKRKHRHARSGQRCQRLAQPVGAQDGGEDAAGNGALEAGHAQPRSVRRAVVHQERKGAGNGIGQRHLVSTMARAVKRRIDQHAIKFALQIDGGRSQRHRPRQSAHAPVALARAFLHWPARPEPGSISMPVIASARHPRRKAKGWRCPRPRPAPARFVPATAPATAAASITASSSGAEAGFGLADLRDPSPASEKSVASRHSFQQPLPAADGRHAGNLRPAPSADGAARNPMLPPSITLAFSSNHHQTHEFRLHPAHERHSLRSRDCWFSTQRAWPNV